MNPALVLRRELPGDVEPTRALHDAAFCVPEGAEHSAETVLLDGLRSDGDVLDTLTLVAELHGEVLGHAVCSRATMGAGTSVALGPIAVRPDHQGQGIGSALVRAGLTECHRRGVGALVVLGHPAYYPRFGFRPASQFGIVSEYDVPDDVFMALELTPGVLEGRAGTIRYHPAFARVGDSG